MKRGAIKAGSTVSKFPSVSFIPYSPWENMAFNRAIYFFSSIGLLQLGSRDQIFPRKFLYYGL